MGRKYQIISGDGHVETPPESWIRYLPEEFRPYAPQLVHLREGGEAWLIEGQRLVPNGQNITGPGPIKIKGGSYFKEDGSPAEGAGDGAQRLREQDKDGIDAEVLFPPIFASRLIDSISDKVAYAALIRAYNTFLARDYCAVAPDRLIGNAVIPVTGIDDALAELEFVAAEGLRTISFHQFPNGSGFAAPEDDAFWKRSLELGIKLSPHFGFGQMSPTLDFVGIGTSGDPFAATLAQRISGIPPVFTMSQLIVAGVFDRFPEIEFYFAETNASWLPWALFVLDDNYEIFRGPFDRKLARLPSEYILDHCWFGIIRDPRAISMRDHLPFDRLMFGSDFPHSVGSYPNTRNFLDDAFEGAPESCWRQMLLENPARYYGLDLDADITETPV
ncbi:MAG: amidohydrolase family protein [Myxococcales bacterium]|nr:amidohydrolase family protein [Myxococcales bacterium]